MSRSRTLDNSNEQFDDGENNPELSDFFAEVNEIKALMEEMTENMNQIKQLYNQQLWNNTDEGSSGQLEGLLGKTNKTANEIRNRLKRMGQENKKLKGTDATARTKINQHGLLANKFINVINEYDNIQKDYKNKYRDRVHRQAKIVDPNVNDEQVDQMIDRGEPSQLFNQKIMHDAKHEEAKNALIYIQEQHKDILQLERSINELHQLFVDMQTLVNAQGEMLNQIEDNVARASEFSSKGLNMLDTAEHKKTSSRIICVVICCICCCVCICIIIVVVVCVVIAAIAIGVGVYFATKGSSN